MRRIYCYRYWRQPEERAKKELEVIKLQLVNDASLGHRSLEKERLKVLGFKMTKGKEAGLCGYKLVRCGPGPRPGEFTSLARSGRALFHPSRPWRTFMPLEDIK